MSHESLTRFAGNERRAGDAGLSRFGLEVVKRLNEHGILIDLSHAGPRSTLEAIERSEGPVAITHSSPEALCDYPRNKTDEQIKLLAQKGGVFGCTFWPQCLKKGPKSALSDYVDTIDYVVDLVGINYAAIASDFCMNRTKTELQKFQGGRAKPWWTVDLDWPVVMPEGLRDAVAEVADHDGDVLDAHVAHGFDLVDEERLVADRHDGLWEQLPERSHPRAVSGRQDHPLILGLCTRHVRLISRRPGRSARCTPNLEPAPSRARRNSKVPEPPRRRRSRPG